MKRLLKFLASLAVTLVFGWWAFRDTHWAEQWASLRSANYVWVLPYLVVLLLIHLCRTRAGGRCSPALERLRVSRAERGARHRLHDAAGPPVPPG